MEWLLKQYGVLSLKSYVSGTYGTALYENVSSTVAYFVAGVVGFGLLCFLHSMSGGKEFVFIAVVIWSSIFALLRNEKLSGIDASIEAWNKASIKQSKTQFVISERKIFSWEDLSWKRGLYVSMLFLTMAIQSNPLVLYLVFVIPVGIWLWMRVNIKFESEL